MIDQKLHSFPPIVDGKSNILILGSMPGAESLRQNQYYAHPRNQFWDIIFSLFHTPLETEYEKRKIFLLKKHIALWDVIHTCDREGSLDTKIKNEQVNDFKTFFQMYPEIRLIAFNGKKAADTFRKYCYLACDTRTCLQLPSTSPAYTLAKQRKKEYWAKILQYL